MKDRTEAFATLVGQGAIGLDKTLKDRTDAFAALVGQSAIGLDTVMKERTKLLATSVSEQSAALDKTLKDRTEAFATLVGQGAIGLDKTLKDRTDAFAALVGQSAIGLDTVMKERTKLLAASVSEQSAALDKTLKERTEAFVTTVGHGALGLDRLLKDRTEAFAATVGEQATALDKTLTGSQRAADHPGRPRLGHPRQDAEGAHRDARNHPRGWRRGHRPVAEGAHPTIGDVHRPGHRGARPDAAGSQRGVQRRPHPSGGAARPVAARPHGGLCLGDQSGGDLARPHARRPFGSLHQLARRSQQGRRVGHRSAYRGHGQAACRPHPRGHHLAHRTPAVDRQCLRPTRRRDRPRARRACARRRGDVRPAGVASQRAARQQLDHDQADRRPGWSSVQGSDWRAHGADACVARGVERAARADPQPDPALREPGAGDPLRRQGARIRRTPRSTRSWRAGIRPSSASSMPSTPRARISTT